MKASSLCFALPSCITFTRWGMLLLLPLLFTSCFKEFQASIDASKQRYKDKDALIDPEANKLGPAVNLALMTTFFLETGDPEGPGSSLNNDVNDNTLWAANDLSSLSLSQSGNGIQALKYKKPAPAFIENIYILTGVEYIGRRSHEGVVKLGLHYLEIPVYAMYQRDLGDGQIFGGVGPYLALGLWGRKQLDFVGGMTTNLAAFDKDEGGYKRIDAGLNWTIGYRLASELSLRLGYDIGLVNIAHPDDQYKERNRTISINVAYPIEKIKEKIGID